MFRIMSKKKIVWFWNKIRKIEFDIIEKNGRLKYIFVVEIIYNIEIILRFVFFK